MDWMSWKTWMIIGVVLIAAFAIYTFAATGSHTENPVTTATAAGSTNARAPHQGRARTVSAPGVGAVHTEWLDMQSGSYKSERNLFSFVEPPPPKPPAPPPPPPDKDKDGIPDFQDNCPAVANPSQIDIDHNGVGDDCQNPRPIPPPPPPPQPAPPPQFTYRFIGTFGNPAAPIATFSNNDQIVNVRVGEIIDNKFILRSIGIESVEIGFVGFPNDVRTRVPLAQ
jgi:hypothetical protein